MKGWTKSNMKKVKHLSWLWAFTFAACSSSDSEGDMAVTVDFAAFVGEETFECGRSYQDLGSSAGVTLTPTDLRFYVHDVNLIDAEGNAFPVDLDEDGQWQSSGVALLDFENGTGSCDNGTASMRTAVTGSVQEGSHVGLAFTLGVPFGENHQDAAVAPAPLNLTAMFWNWNGGYKFLKFDAVTSGPSDDFRIHLGSTGCEENADGAVVSCAQPNRVVVTLDGFDVMSDSVRVDLAAVLSESAVGVNAPDTPPGCMSSPGDPDCVPVFDGMGLGAAGPPAQRLFSVR